MAMNNDDISDPLGGIDIEGLVDLRAVRLFPYITDGSRVQAAHLQGVRLEERRILSDRSWCLFEIMYEYCGGFQTFTDAQQMAQQSSLIYVIYDGQLSRLEDFSIDKCYVIGCFKSKCGLKLVGMAKNPFVENKLYLDSAVRKMIVKSASIGWFEVSDRAESRTLRVLGRKKIIPASTVQAKAFPGRSDFKVCDDGLHYIRSIDGIPYRKIASGVMR